MLTSGGDQEEVAGFDQAMRRYMLGGLLGAAAVVLLFGIGVARDVGQLCGLFASGSAVAAAAAGAGALLGFLFGIPRTLQREASATRDGPQYMANTNLEQISDWLTKILVGIGLVQIGRAPEALGDLARTLAPLFGGRSGSGGFGLTLCIFGVVYSFLLTYLWTRVRLKRQLELGDRDIKKAVDAAISERASADADALSLVERQLSGQNPPTEVELATALGQASKSTLVLIYQRAEDLRYRTWHAPDKLAEHNRTIPVFKALIANDQEEQFHRHFGSLGFALKDTRPPDRTGAIAALTTAIKIRGPAEDRGFPIYEWNRAVCRIRLTEGDGAAPDPSAEADIETDLRTAAAAGLPSRFFTDSSDHDVQAVASWMKARDLSYAAIRSARTRTKAG